MKRFLYEMTNNCLTFLGPNSNLAVSPFFEIHNETLTF